MFLDINYSIFAAGMGLEMVYHLVLNPWADIGHNFANKKILCLLYLILAALIPVIVIVVRLSKKTTITWDTILEGIQEYNLIPLFAALGVLCVIACAIKIGNVSHSQEDTTERSNRLATDAMEMEGPDPEITDLLGDEDCNI